MTTAAHTVTPDPMYRQGDVLLVLLVGGRAIPADALEVPRDLERGLVLQDGKATGHAHRITSHAAKMFTAGAARYLRVAGPAPALIPHVVPAHQIDVSAVHDGSDMIDVPERTILVPTAHPGTAVDLVHDEHAAVPVPPGDYQIVIHHEYSPGDLPRQVED